MATASTSNVGNIRQEGTDYPMEDISLWMNIEAYLLGRKSVQYFMFTVISLVMALASAILLGMSPFFWQELDAIFIACLTFFCLHALYSIIMSFSYYIQSEEHKRGSDLPEKFCQQLCAFFKGTLTFRNLLDQTVQNPRNNQTSLEQAGSSVSQGQRQGQRRRITTHGGDDLPGMLPVGSSSYLDVRMTTQRTGSVQRPSGIQSTPNLLELPQANLQQQGQSRPAPGSSQNLIELSPGDSSASYRHTVIAKKVSDVSTDESCIMEECQLPSPGGHDER